MGKYTGKSYSAIRKIADLPTSSRQAIAIGRDNARRKPRRFHLVTDKMDEARKLYEETKEIPVPFNRGSYFYIVKALIDLGVDQAHKYAAFKTRVRELMSASDTKQTDDKGNETTAWERFRDREARNDNGQDVDGRLYTNVTVLQRFGGFTPYGLKLLEVGKKVMKTKGLVIDVLKVDGEKMIRLNTDSAKPVNEWKGKRGRKAGVPNKVKTPATV